MFVLVCYCCCDKVLGFSPSGWKYLLPRPTREEVELQLWRMLFSARQREEEMKQECKMRDGDFFKRERDLKIGRISLRSGS